MYMYMLEALIDLRYVSIVVVVCGQVQNELHNPLIHQDVCIHPPILNFILAYNYMYGDPYRTAKLKSANTVAIMILGSIAKFKFQPILPAIQYSRHPRSACP